MRTRNRAGLFALLVVTVVSGGCGSPGPWTPANAINNYPPKVRGVSWVVLASVVVVSYQPYDATRVEVDGWGIYPSCNFDGNTPRVHLYWNLREGLDTQHGRGYFLVVSTDWSGWSGERPMLADLEHWLLISVHDPDGQRVGVELWRLADGQAEHVRSAPGSMLVGQTVMPVAAFEAADRLALARQLAAKTIEAP